MRNIVKKIINIHALKMPNYSILLNKLNFLSILQICNNLRHGYSHIKFKSSTISE